MKKAICCLMGMALLAGCATMDSAKSGSASPAEARFLGDYYNKMVPGPVGGAKMRWIKPGVEFGKYNKVMVDSVVFFFDDGSEYKGIDPQELKELADSFNRQIVTALQGKYPVVAEPGADVVRLRYAITDLKQSRPVVSGVSSVVPVGLGISILKKGATGSWSGSGATGAEMMALDSLTNEVIAVAKDEKTAGFTGRFTKWGSSEEAFKFWGERAKLFLDQAHGVK
ncbi:MAG: DUF3313 domain-containing protein [Deltaproteobacteria bacterium]|nr:DUF3313 domain-containing protein [Deltaproteobacteria bacterium]